MLQTDVKQIMNLNVLIAFFYFGWTSSSVTEAIEENYVIGWLGQEVRFPCNFTGEALAVYWGKVNNSQPEIIDPRASYFKQNIHSSDDGRFTMAADFSLGITDLRVSDEGRYKCHFETISGDGFRRYTYLTVQALASTPEIAQCDQSPEGNEIQSFCTSKTSHAFPKYNLDCHVAGFRPNITLEWTSSGIVKQPLGEPFQRTLPDGTSEIEVSISVIAKADHEQNYTCTVTGKATNGISRSATIMVLSLPVTEPRGGLTVGKKAAIVFPVFILMISLPVILVFLHRKGKLPRRVSAVLDQIPFTRVRDQNNDTELPSAPKLGENEVPDVAALEVERLLREAEKQRQMQEKRETLRNEINEYKPGKFARISSNVSKVNLGLFGLVGIGKSSFINSLFYALRGTYEEITEEGTTDNETKTKFRLSFPITAHINLIDNRGMKDYSHGYVYEVLAQIRGMRGQDPGKTINYDKENQLQCALFVYEDKLEGRNASFSFISKFFVELAQLPQSAYLVVTHKDGVEDLEMLISCFCSSQVPESKIVCFENYTCTKHDEKIDKDIEMLEFLKKALQTCDWNIHHQEQKERQEANNPSRCHVM